MSRTTLVNLVRAMFGALALVFVFVLLRSLGGPALSTSVNSPFDDVEIGETALRRYQGQRVWVSRLSPQLITMLRKIDAVVEDKNSGCAPDVTLCVVLAKTSVDGIEIRYSAKRPANIARSTPWAGGYVNPNTLAVFDLLGRAYIGTNSSSKPSLSLVKVEQAQ